MSDFVQSEYVGLQSAPESALGTQATSGWRTEDPNQSGITDFYPELKHVAREPISPNMMAEKGAVVGLTTSPKLKGDLHRDFLERWAGAMFCSTFKHPGGTGQSKFSVADGTLTAVTGTAYTVTANGALADGILVYASGFSTSGNNGLKVLSGTSTGTSIKASGLTAESSPPTTAVLYVVGVQASSGDVTVTSGGNLASTTLDFTSLGLQAGAFAWLGGGTAASPGSLGFATAADRGFFRMKTITASLITVDRRTQAWSADSGTGKTIQIFFGPWIRNVPGTHSDYREPSFSLEVSYPGAGAADATAYAYAVGACVSEAKISAPSEDKITTDLSFVGMNFTAPSTTRATGANSPIAPLGNGAFTTADQVRRLRIAKLSDETEVTTSIFDWNLTLSKNIKPRVQQGTLGAAGMMFGRFTAMLDTTVYFKDLTACDAIRANTTCSWDVALQSTDCCAVFDVPSFDPMGGNPDIKPNEAVTLPVQGGSWRDQTFSFVAALTILPYIPAS